VPPERLYTGVTAPVDGAWQAHLSGRYGITPSDYIRQGWGTDTGTGDLVLPLYDRNEVRRGSELKSRRFYLDGENVRRKTKLYCTSAAGACSFLRPRRTRDRRVVVVEDMLSATKVARAYTSACLHGTNLGRAKLEEIVEEGKIIVIALDQDATLKSYKLLKEWGLYADFRVAVLDKDLKYEDDERIRKIVEDAK